VTNFYLAAASILFGWIIYTWFINTERQSLNSDTRSMLGGCYVATQKGMVHYEMGGNPDLPLVILVHGFSTPAYIWDPTFEALAKADFRVLRYDLFGRGYSDRLKAANDLELFVHQLEVLLPALEIHAPFHLVGLSMGGLIAAEFAVRHPDRIQSLTLIDPVVSNIFRKNAFWLNLPLLGELIMALVLAPARLPKSQSADFAHPLDFPDWQQRFRQQMRFKGFRRSILSTIRSFSRLDTLGIYRKLGKLNIAPLILRGEKDQTISAQDIAILRGVLPMHTFHAIQDAGHIPHFERPAVVNPILMNFFRKNSGR